MRVSRVVSRPMAFMGLYIEGRVRKFGVLFFGQGIWGWVLPDWLLKILESQSGSYMFSVSASEPSNILRSFFLNLYTSMPIYILLNLPL